ncbi:MAG: O-antigen ligase family protein [bacterium]
MTESPGLPLTLAEMGERLRARPPLARIAFVGLIGFALSAPFSISVSQIFVFGAIAAWLLSLWREEAARPARFPLWRPFALFAALTVASAALSDDPARSLKDTRQLVQILIFYCALNTMRDDAEGVWLTRALLAATGFAAVFTLGAALAFPLGLTNRMSGFFSIYMTLGGFLLVVGSLAFAYLMLPGGPPRGAWVWAAGALIIAALMTTFSRNAWLGLLVASLAVVLAGRSRRGIALLAAAGLAVLLLSPASVRQRLRSIGDPKDRTAVERIYMWESGLRMVRDRPLLGFGLDMIKRNYTGYADPRAVKKRTGHLHNNILHIAAERGLPALAAWLWVWAAYFWAVWRGVRATRAGPFARRFRMVGGLAALAGFFAAGFFEYNFGDSEVVMTAYLAMALPFMGEDP